MTTSTATQTKKSTEKETIRNFLLEVARKNGTDVKLSANGSVVYKKSKGKKYRFKVLQRVVRFETLATLSLKSECGKDLTEWVRIRSYSFSHVLAQAAKSASK